MNELNTSGIYKIVNRVNGKIYVGSAVCIKKRWRQHKTLLKQGIHHNLFLQRSWNRDKEESFVFSVLEKTKREFLLEREQYWMDAFQSYNQVFGYNIAKVAGSSLGIKRSEDYKKRSSAARSGELSAMSKMTWDSVFEIRKLYKDGLNLSEIGRMFNVTSGCIRPIIKNKSWKDENYTYIKIEPKHKKTNSKFLIDDVKKMRSEYESGEKSLLELSEIYNTNFTTIHSIVSYRNWNFEGKEIYKKPRNKKKYRKGADNTSSFLTEQQVCEMRKKYENEDVTIVEIAKQYEINPSTAQGILSYKTWNAEGKNRFYKPRQKSCDSPSAKLIKEQIKEIKNFLCTREKSRKEISEIYNIDLSTISRIATNKIHKDI